MGGEVTSLRLERDLWSDLEDYSATLAAMSIISSLRCCPINITVRVENNPRPWRVAVVVVERKGVKYQVASRTTPKPKNVAELYIGATLSCAIKISVRVKNKAAIWRTTVCIIERMHYGFLPAIQRIVLKHKDHARSAVESSGRIKRQGAGWASSVFGSTEIVQ